MKLVTNHGAPGLLEMAMTPQRGDFSATVASSPRLSCIAHITPGLEMGGLEKLLVEFARHADRQRFRLLFVSLGSRGVLASEIEEAGWPVYCLHQPQGLRPNLILKLGQLFRRHRVDVVHTHATRPLVYSALAARRGSGGRLIHTRHGQNLDLTRRQLFLMRLATVCADYFVCVSHDAAEIAGRQGIPRSKIVTIQNGIDVKRFASVPRGDNGHLVVVARLSPEKDISTLLRAMALARRAVPAVKLTVVGDGPCGPALRSEAQSLGLTDSVRFAGEVADVRTHLLGARLFVLPSVSEGVSLTLLEAMAAGIAVIATRVGGTPEVVQDNRTGVLVPARDPQALASAIVRLWGDRAERRRLSDAALRHVGASFSVQHMIQQYESLYTAPAAQNSPESARKRVQAASLPARYAQDGA